MKKRNVIQIAKRFMAGTLAFVMALGMAISVDGLSFKSEAAGSRTVTLLDGRYTSGQLRVGYFELDGGTKAMCACHEMQPPAQGSVLSQLATYTYENKANEQLRKVMYYGWGGPGDVGGTSDGDHYRETALAISVANGHQDNYYGYGQAFINRIASKSNAPKGFNVFKIGNNSGLQDLVYFEWNPTGTLLLQKTSANAELTDNNACYSLEGAVYEVYSDASCTKKVGTLTVDAKGKSNKIDLNYGDYYVKEVTAPKGYAPDADVHKVTVKAGETFTLKVTEAPLNDPAALSLEKIDKETGSTFTQGAASLEGAEFTIIHYGKYYSQEEIESGEAAKDAEKNNIEVRKWIVKTIWNEASQSYLTGLDEKHKVSGDDFYYAFSYSKNPCLPLGTVTIEETKAPKGYILDGNKLTATETGETYDRIYCAQIKSNKDGAFLTSGNEYYIEDNVSRGDVGFIKIADGTANRLANVPFEIVSKTTGERHVVVTNANGEISTTNDWAAHSENTNANDNATEENYDPYAGVWFGLNADGTSVPVDDSRGALPYDEYVLNELPCTANEGYVRLTGIEFSVDEHSNGKEINLGTLTDDELQPYLKTRATDKKTGLQQAYVSKNSVLNDEADYHSVIPGRTYKMVGEPTNADTKQAITQDGKKVTNSLTFVAEKSSGTVSLDFEFDSTDLRGVRVVMKETLYEIKTINGEQVEVEVARHDDLDDMDQSVQFMDPTIKTIASDSELGGHQALPGENTTIYDKVMLTGLINGLEFTVGGVEKDKDTEKPLLVTDAEGEDSHEVTANKTFVADDSEQIVELPFTFPSIDLAGKSVVACETLYYGDEVIAKHDDMDDADQTVTFVKPTITTSAKDKASGTKEVDASAAAAIVDVASIKTLIPGYTYVLRGVLMDAATKDTLKVNGEEIRQELTFVADKVDQDVEMEFTLDASNLRGVSSVVFEKLYIVTKNGEVEVASHEDITSKDQTVKFPDIEISGNIDKKQTLAGDGDTYSYTIDYCSTSNTWADELNMTDTLDCVKDGYARLVSVKTPVSFDDYDGKMNVWYQTNKTDEKDTSDSEKYNACSTNPTNPENPDNERMTDYTGWKIWKADVSTLVSETLNVSDLKLADGEYITGVRFEHGRVERGFTTRKLGDDSSELDEKKSEQDNIKTVVTPYSDTFDLSQAANEELRSEQFVNYAPAVMEMKVISEDYKKGKIELWNTAEMNIFRNKGTTDKLRDDDKDKVVQKHAKENPVSKVVEGVQTGDPGIISMIILLILGLTTISLLLAFRKKRS